MTTNIWECFSEFEHFFLHIYSINKTRFFKIYNLTPKHQIKVGNFGYSPKLEQNELIRNSICWEKLENNPSFLFKSKLPQNDLSLRISLTILKYLILNNLNSELKLTSFKDHNPKLETENPKLKYFIYIFLRKAEISLRTQIHGNTFLNRIRNRTLIDYTTG